MSICRHYLAGRCIVQGCRFLHPPLLPAEACEKQRDERYHELREMVRAAVAAVAAAAPTSVQPPPPPRTYPLGSIPTPPPPVYPAEVPKAEEAPKAQAKARPVVKRLLVPKPPDTLPPAAAGWNVYLEKEADPETEEAAASAVTPGRLWWRAWLAQRQAEEAERLQAEEAEAARLKAEEDEAARLRKVPQTPPRKKRLLEPTPKWNPCKAGKAEEEEEEEEERSEEEVFRDVQTSQEAEAEAARLQIIDDYLLEEN